MEHHNKRMKIMLLVVGVLFGVIFLYKGVMSLVIKHYMASQSHAVPVSIAKVAYANWQPTLSATGSVRAIQGVNVTTELAGMVTAIHFIPGSVVQEGALLIELNADTERAALEALKASAALAKITYDRDKAQYAVSAVSKQTLDSDLQQLKNLDAQVMQQAAVVAKKTIRAPFSGRLGINLVNKGQYLNPGDTITMLQMIDPIYVDFYLPQQTLAQIKVGLPVVVRTDAYPQDSFKGTVTSINPGVDVATRNVLVEATLANPKGWLTPGMFANISIDVGKEKRYLTLAQTAVSFNPYGEIVYVIYQKDEDKHKKQDKARLFAKQVFVTTGETRGDQVTILKGLKEGQTVVTSGQLKLKNDAEVTINNSIVPSDKIHPDTPNDH